MKFVSFLISLVVVVKTQANVHDLGDATAVHVLDEEVHSSRRLLELAGSRRLEYTISAFEEDFDLELELHPHLNNRDIHVYELNEKHGYDRQVKNLNCIYKGKLKNSKNSKVTMSFCEGRLLGHIVTDTGRKLTVRPLRENRRLTGVYLHDVEGRTHVPWKCGVTSDFKKRRLGGSNGEPRPVYYDAHSPSNFHSGSTISSMNGRNLASYFFEVLTVADHHMYNDYLDSTFYITLVLFSFMADLWTGFPGGDTITMQLVGIIIFRTDQPWAESSSCASNNFLTCHFLGDSLPLLGSQCCVQLLNSQQSQNVDNNNIGSLAVFQQWGIDFDAAFLNDDGTALNFDIAHLLTGLDFRTNSGGDFVVGLAYLGVSCSDGSQAYGTTQATSTDYESIATVWAHELGHNLGFSHDDNPSPTPTPIPRPCRGGTPSSDFIMDTSSSGPVTQWSQCSSDDWDDYKSECSGAEVTTTTNNINSAGYCGNGVLDPGEQCDCGLANCGSLDPCCDGDSCTYLPGKTCAANDLCCDMPTCTSVKANGEVCRPALSECDDVEVCDGVAKTCPEEGIIFAKATGESCTTSIGTGTCYRERCLVGEEICQPTTNFCSVNSNCELICGTSTCPASSFFTVKAPNGFECDTNKGCYEGDCIAFSEIPLESNCSNFQLDPGETDVDCGGPDCLGCVAGKICLTDDDCLGTRKCVGNETSGKVCSDPENSLGDQLLDLWNQFLDWINQNPLLAGIAGALILLALLSCCLAPLCSSPKRREAMKTRFRSFRTYENAPYGNTAYRNEQVLVAQPVGGKI